MSNSKLSPSYFGYVGSTKDALLIIQEILDKQLELVPRRPLEGERPQLIKSGHVFVFIEEHSGIKRWTDGIAWSPSRILGRFLVYRELDKQTLNEKDDKKKKKRKLTSDDSLNGSSKSSTTSPQIVSSNIPASNSYSSSDYNKSLLSGPLVTSYVFKDQGLIKKTLSLTTKTKDLHIDKREEKQTIHLISYYNADDVMNGKLQRPSESDLKNVNISPSLWSAIKQSSLGGKIPIEDEAFYFLDGNYQLQNMSLLQQPSQATYSKAQPQTAYAKYSNGLGQPQQYMLPIPNQPLPSGDMKDETGGMVTTQNPELAFINPFSAGHQGSNPAIYNGQAYIGAGSVPGTTQTTSIPVFNNYLVAQQQPGQSQTQQQYISAAYVQGGNNHDMYAATHFPPFAQHYAQQVVGPRYHYSSISSDPFGSTGSISSASSNLFHNGNNSNANTPNGRKYNNRVSSSSTTSLDAGSASQTGSSISALPPQTSTMSNYGYGAASGSTQNASGSNEYDSNHTNTSGNTESLPYQPARSSRQPFATHPLTTISSVPSSTATIGANDEASGNANGSFYSGSS
ncbi:TOS9 [[Candida] subhashii]|uniref:TOS9 n=1 Tax=[Candida] subhashii TaxID=561895 RepID=A0A8J5QGE4_9ASCO|nr:TOS9 [[Candida] subhashii]KAG7664086.1 TOS9 [[Candida] subhashii]